MRLNSKSQSAMEYLMTYGWAILIILIAVGALFYLGVFSPSTPNTCMFNTPFSCIGGDVKGSTGSNYINFNVGFSTGSSGGIVASGITINGQAMTLTPQDVFPIGAANYARNTCYSIPLATGFSGWIVGTQKEIRCSATIGVTGATVLAQRTKFNGQVSFTSTSEAGIVHTTTGSFSGTMEA